MVLRETRTADYGDAPGGELERFAVTGPIPAAVATADIDDLAVPVAPLLAVAAQLTDQIGNAFGVPQLDLVIHTGELSDTLGRDEWGAELRAWLRQPTFAQACWSHRGVIHQTSTATRAPPTAEPAPRMRP